MKSKRAEEFINNRSELIDGLEWMVDASTARRAVELAEQDAEEEIEDKCKGFVEILETLQEEHEQLNVYRILITLNANYEDYSFKNSTIYDLYYPLLCSG